MIPQLKMFYTNLKFNYDIFPEDMQIVRIGIKKFSLNTD